MRLLIVVCAAICLLVVFVSGAEESADPSITSGDVRVSNLEQDDHGPLMKALLTPGEGALHRQKRTLKGGKGKKGGGGGCGCYGK